MCQCSGAVLKRCDLEKNPVPNPVPTFIIYRHERVYGGVRECVQGYGSVKKAYWSGRNGTWRCMTTPKPLKFHKFCLLFCVGMLMFCLEIRL